jgi:hypothetical protein
MIPYLARLLDITMNNNAIPGDWTKKKKEWFPFQSLFGHCRPVSLSSVVCKQMEHVLAGYLKHVWEMSGWLYES